MCILYIYIYLHKRIVMDNAINSINPQKFLKSTDQLPWSNLPTTNNHLAVQATNTQSTHGPTCSKLHATAVLTLPQCRDPPRNFHYLNGFDPNISQLLVSMKRNSFVQNELFAKRLVTQKHE